MALAEERRDTCPSCGLLKAVCRSPEYQFAFRVDEDQCHASRVIASHQMTPEWKQKHDDTRQATQLSVAFREGNHPPLDIGLDLAESPGDEDNDPED